jgi:hypothetical protein
MPFVLRLDDAQDALLAKAASNQGRTKTAIVRMALTAFLDGGLAPILRNAENALTDVIDHELMTNTRDPRLAGYRASAQSLIITLAAIAGNIEAYEATKEVSAHYADFQIHD